MKVKFLKYFGWLFAALSVVFVGTALGEVTPITLSSVETHVGDTVLQVSRILTDISLIAGISFILASFFKFHQHKLNPTQVPISQGVTLLLIGAALTVFVIMIPTAKKALFGDVQSGKIGGDQMKELIGGGAN